MDGYIWVKMGHEWAPKSWCFQIVGLKKALESPLDSKEIKPVNPKGSQPWIFFAEGKAPIIWPPDVKSLLIRKDPDAGKDWGQEEKGMIEGEMVGWLNGHEFHQTQEDSEGQGSLVCCSSWGHKESDMISNWTKTVFKWWNIKVYSSIFVYTWNFQLKKKFFRKRRLTESVREDEEQPKFPHRHREQIGQGGQGLREVRTGSLGLADAN